MPRPEIELMSANLDREPTAEELEGAELEIEAMIDAIVDMHEEEEL